MKLYSLVILQCLFQWQWPIVGIIHSCITRGHKTISSLIWLFHNSPKNSYLSPTVLSNYDWKIVFLIDILHHMVDARWHYVEPFWCCLHSNAIWILLWCSLIYVFKKRDLIQKWSDAQHQSQLKTKDSILAHPWALLFSSSKIGPKLTIFMMTYLKQTSNSLRFAHTNFATWTTEFYQNQS